MEKMELVTKNDQEAVLDKEITSIEKAADAFVIRTDSDFKKAGDFAKNVKSVQKKVKEYWEPMRESTYKAYKSVTDHKKEMLEPLEKAEKIMKEKMGEFRMEQKRIAEEKERLLRKLAREEMEKKLAEAAKAAEDGDGFTAEYAMAEAEMLDNMSKTATLPVEQMKVAGVSQRKTWRIDKIDLSKLPVEFQGVLIRPADEKAIMQLIKDTDGKIEIPGVEFEETVGISVRAS